MFGKLWIVKIISNELSAYLKMHHNSVGVIGRNKRRVLFEHRSKMKKVRLVRDGVTPTFTERMKGVHVQLSGPTTESYTRIHAHIHLRKCHRTYVGVSERHLISTVGRNPNSIWFPTPAIPRELNPGSKLDPQVAAIWWCFCIGGDSVTMAQLNIQPTGNLIKVATQMERSRAPS